MVQITKENGMQSAAIPFAWVEVQYPDKAQWDEAGFYDMVEQHLAALREQYRDYVRADVFGQNLASLLEETTWENTVAGPLRKDGFAQQFFEK